MSLGPYASFIVTSYLLVTAVVLILIAWIAIDYRRQKQTPARTRSRRRRQALRAQRDGYQMSEPSTTTTRRTANPRAG